jgi:hypothetical protein
VSGEPMMVVGAAILLAVVIVAVIERSRRW